MQIGYEATVADICYSYKIFEHHGLKFKFKGYNDKIDKFIYEFFKIFRKIAEEGLTEADAYLIDSSCEKRLKEYKNLNVEID